MHDASSVRNDDRRLPSTSTGVSSETAAKCLPLRSLTTNIDAAQTIRNGEHFLSATSSHMKGDLSGATHTAVISSASSYDLVSKGPKSIIRRPTEYKPSHGRWSRTEIKCHRVALKMRKIFFAHSRALTSFTTTPKGALSCGKSATRRPNKRGRLRKCEKSRGGRLLTRPRTHIHRRTVAPRRPLLH